MFLAVQKNVGRMAEHVLIVEDDAAVRGLLAAVLNRAGHRVSEAEDWSEAAAVLNAASVDLILLDLTLPDASGLSLTRSVRALSNAPIIIVSERGGPEERAQGLEFGAEDYVPKPVFARELLARVRNVLGRRQPLAATASSVWRIESANLDPAARTVCGSDGIAIDLTPTEFDLLQILTQRSPRIQSRDQLMDALGTGEGDSGARSIDILVSRLRRKMGPVGAFIETERGHGYRFSGRVQRGG